MPSTRIVLITTGGTVASRTTAGGAVPVLSAADLLPRAEADGLAIDTVDVMSVDSSAMTVSQQFAIVTTITDALADPSVDGVVVTHGTDTMEETSYLADIVVTGDRPVVFTGAQYPADSPHSDGPNNIAAAVRAAADPAQRGRGVLVALGSELRSARGIFKVSTTKLAAFDNVSADLARRTVSGPLGHPVRVDLFGLYPGVSPGIIAAAVDQRAAGIVLAATGSGNTHPDITAEVLAATRAGVVVVVTSRVPYGEVIPTYGGGGGAVDLERAGAVVSRWLRAPQARIALIALLSTGADVEGVREFFARTGPT
ncbi:asparaginase [Gordonia sp. CPCC 205515]|uniref:asparaginase n=1 Tax=Gordonia sp. CPCC 205515 TaxID=3140791 RepID=UPI003AF3DB51